MNTPRCFLLLLALLVTDTRLEARAVRLWSYAELTGSADVVVIAKPLSNIDTKDLFEGKTGYIGVNTNFQVLDNIKENVGAEKFTVLHFAEGSLPGIGICFTN